MTAQPAAVVEEAPVPPGPRWCGTVSRCNCGLKLTPNVAKQLSERPGIPCAHCGLILDTKTYEAMS